MPKISLLLLLFVLVFSSACQLKPVEEDEFAVQEVGDGVVSLASEAGMVEPLHAVFLSRNGSFYYEMTYDGAVMNIVETEDLSVPRFEVEGGAVLELRSDWVDLASRDAEMAGEPVRKGAYDVYQFMDSEAACSLNRTLIPFAQEYLELVLRICEGSDGDAGRKALDQILEHLVLSSN